MLGGYDGPVRYTRDKLVQIWAWTRLSKQGTRLSRIFSGDFHMPFKKFAFFPAFFAIFPCVPVFPWL